MAGRQTRGRQRIPIRLIENQDDLYATFSKRRLGLYKKASELSTLCGVDIGIIIFSPTDNPFSFFHPNMESVIDRYRNPDQPQSSYARAVESLTRTRIENLNRELDEILEEKEKLKEHNKYLDEIDTARGRGWWETPIDSLNREQVKEWIAWFQAFKAKIETRIEEIENGGSTSRANQQQQQQQQDDPQNAPDAPGPSTGVGPSIFAPAPSYANALTGANQFPGQYYDIPQQPEDPSSADGSGHAPGQYFYLPPPQDSPAAGGGTGQYFLSPLPQDLVAGAGSPGRFFYPPPPQDPSAGRGSGSVPGQLFLPPPPRDPISGDGSDHVLSPFFFPPPSLDSSAAGGSSHIPGQFFYPPLSQGASGRGSGQFFLPPAPPSAGGGNVYVPGQLFLPPPPLNLSAGGGSTDLTPGQLNYIPPGSRNRPTAAEATEEASASNQELGGN